jgi:hypothetical protein
MNHGKPEFQYHDTHPRKETSTFRIGVVLIVLALIAALFFISANARADEVTLNFIPPTQRIDNSPLAPGDIKEYEVQRAPTLAGTYVRVGNALGNTNKTHKFSDAPTGAQCYRLITVDTADRRSEPSMAACVNTSPPKGATGVTISVTVTVNQPP